MTDPQAEPFDIPRVLVVDDESDIELMFRQRFRRKIKHGLIELKFARNGAEALAIVEQDPELDLVVTDINMPVMDGLELIGELRAKYPLVKSVVVSAYNDMGNLRRAMNRGAFDFLTKPVDFEDFEAVLERTLEHVRRVRRTLRSVSETGILRMFVDDESLAFLLRGEGSEAPTKTERVDATVVFIGVCHFTRLAEGEQPERAVQLLNVYFDSVVGDIVSRDGAVDKFMGDALMAVFRGDGHLERACRACLDIRSHVNNLRSALQADLELSPNVTIGLDSGPVVVGNVGAACVNRYDFTVIGEVVNTAVHLRTQAAPGEIYVPAHIREKMGGQFEFDARGAMRLKGKRERTEIHAIISVRDREEE